MYRQINEKEIEKELKSFKKISLYTCDKECQDSCIHYEGKYCIRCIPLEKGYGRLQTKEEQLKVKNKMSETKEICLCWLSECDCQFQRHRKIFTLCESLEIWKRCVKKEPLNCGDDD